MVGEASLSLATACFGKAVSGNSGHDENDVLYIAFTGEDAVPGKKANWAAKTFDEFEESIEPLGDRLIQRISARNGRDRATKPSKARPQPSAALEPSGEPVAQGRGRATETSGAKPKPSAALKHSRPPANLAAEAAAPPPAELQSSAAPPEVVQSSAESASDAAAIPTASDCEWPGHCKGKSSASPESSLSTGIAPPAFQTGHNN
ncbi:hypothetical protein CDD83_2417 [Cordyceps sp. RAO-2017]|nr:hypothetical protein CDD83_2417 [Cordyceps sp. RAO-2017]